MPESSEVVVFIWKHVEPSKEQARINAAAFIKEILGEAIAEHKRGGSDSESEVGPRVGQGAVFKSLGVLKVILPNT